MPQPTPVIATKPVRGILKGTFYSSEVGYTFEQWANSPDGYWTETSKLTKTSFQEKQRHTTENQEKYVRYEKNG